MSGKRPLLPNLLRDLERLGIDVGQCSLQELVTAEAQLRDLELRADIMRSLVSGVRRISFGCFALLGADMGSRAFVTGYSSPGWLPAILLAGGPIMGMFVLLRSG